MEGKSTGDLLEELRRIGAVNAPAFLDDSEYITQYEQYKQTLIPSNEYPRKMKLFYEKIKLVASRNQEGSFRVCSIGCGDGLVDKDILSALVTEYPDRHVQYVGIDVSETYCQLAKDNLKPGRNVDISILNQNFLNFCSESFDFIIAMHSLYYLPCPEDGVKKILSLMKDHGMAVVALRSHDALFKPHGALCCAEQTVVYSDVFAAAMSTLGVCCEHTTYNYTQDLTQCLHDKFQSPIQQNVLNFIAHVKLQYYSERVTQLVIAYLDSICYGKPEKALLDITVDLFCIDK